MRKKNKNPKTIKNKTYKYKLHNVIDDERTINKTNKQTALLQLKVGHFEKVL